MSRRSRVKFLKDLIADAIKRVNNPLSYFDAKNVILAYAEHTITGKVDLTGLPYLAPEIILSLIRKRISMGDILQLKEEHQANNQVLRDALAYLMHQKIEGRPVSVYEAKDDIEWVLAGGRSRLPGNYTELISNSSFHFIDSAHVFEKCHLDAINALATISNLPPEEALKAVVSVSNHALLEYPRLAQEARDEAKRTVIRFVLNGEGSLEDFEKRMQRETVDNRLIEANPLFIKYLLTAEFKNELKTEIEKELSKKVMLNNRGSTMSHTNQVTVLHQVIEAAMTREVRPLSYFDAIHTVLWHATNSITLQSDRSGVRQLSFDLITKILHAGITAEDISYFKAEHAKNNQILREQMVYLMGQKKADGTYLNVYEAKAEILKVINRLPPTYPGNYANILTGRRINYIDQVHVFEDCHLNAVHAMVSISNLSPAEAFDEVTRTVNPKLMTYPKLAEETKQIVKEEGVRFIRSQGSDANLESHIKGMMMSPSFNINMLFYKNLFTEKFIQEMKLEASAAFNMTAESMIAKLNSQMPKRDPALDHSFTNRFVRTAIHPTQSETYGAGFLLAASNHVSDNAPVYVILAAIILGALYRAGYYNPLRPVQSFYNSIFRSPNHKEKRNDQADSEKIHLIAMKK